VCTIFDFNNNKNRQVNKNIQSKKQVYLGDIALSYQYIKKIIEKEKVTFDNYFKKMLVHGILHLVGHEHESLKQYKKMNFLEKKIIKNI
jgi:probable rRNA maturation factor